MTELSDPRVPGGGAGKKVTLGGTETESGESAGLTVDADGLGKPIAGERNPSSETNSYLSVANDCNGTVLLSTGSGAIGGGAANDTQLLGFTIGTALAGILTISGFKGDNDAAENIIFPIGTPPGFYDFKGAVNSAGALTMVLASGTDNRNVFVLWRPV